MIVQKSLDGKVIAEYTTKSQAAKQLGINESSIRRAISQNRTVLGKFKFSYSDGISAKAAPVLQSPARILIVDIETAPIKAYVWRLWKQDVFIDQIISDWFMLSWSAKFLGEDEVYYNGLEPDEVANEDDGRIVKNLWLLLDSADILVAHNGNQFDIPKMNSRFVVNGLKPPSPYKQIDTKVIAKNQFGFSSNKLEALARTFGLEGKFDTDFDLWKRCLEGDVDAMAYMVEYNCKDVLVLEEVYLKLRPYAKGHPNLDLYVDDDTPSCPHCGSKHIHKMENKFFFTQSVKYETFRCTDCGAISRAKQGLKYINKKQISAIPK